MQIPDTYLTIHEELLLFLWSCLLGGALGILFDGFRALRLIVPHKGWATALEDMVFLLIWAGSIVCFTSVLAKGDLRIYYILGSMLGFALYHCTLGNPVVQILRRILGAIVRLIRICFHPLYVLLVRIHSKCTKKFVRNAKNEGKIKNICAALLIAPQKMLYNKRNKKRKQGEKNRGTQKKCKTPKCGAKGKRQRQRIQKDQT